MSVVAPKTFQDMLDAMPDRSRRDYFSPYQKVILDFHASGSRIATVETLPDEFRDYPDAEGWTKYLNGLRNSMLKLIRRNLVPSSYRIYRFGGSLWLFDADGLTKAELKELFNRRVMPRTKNNMQYWNICADPSVADDQFASEAISHIT